MRHLQKLIVAVVILFAGTTAKGEQTLQATLSGALDTPAPLVFRTLLQDPDPLRGCIDSPDACAVGQITIVSSSAMDTMFYRLEDFAISNVTDQHIHQGDPGVGGPIAFPLPGVLAIGSPISGSFAVTAAQVDQFVAGAFYVDMHTQADPAGLVRARIVPFSPAVRHSAMMSGAQETPPIPGTANGVMRFKLTSNTALQFAIEVKNISSTITAADLHSGAAGSTGPVVLALYGGTGVFDEAYPYSGTVSLTPEQLVDFLARDTYATVKTANNPGGEIRGRLRPTMPGDANGDSCACVTASDIFYLINYLFADGPLPDAGDSNGDEITTVADVFYLINSLFGGGPYPRL